MNMGYALDRRPRTTCEVKTLKSLRVVAVSAPESPSGKKSERALNSEDPASLYNACRLAASRTSDPSSAWWRSNWRGSRRTRRDCCLLMHAGSEMPAFERLLHKERPNLVLIGAMTICLRGAIECATVARQILGEGVLIVLGGRHASETIHLGDATLRAPASVKHHAASPATLMQAGKIPHVFDIVLSGDGEYFIAELGEHVARVPANVAGHAAAIMRSLGDSNLRGDWIATALHDGQLEVVVSRGLPVLHAELPSPVSMFGVSTSFEIFDGRLTAHCYSDTGRGCIYSCQFCSEGSAVTGAPTDLANSADRLYRQLRDVVNVVSEDHPGRRASGFVEDSVLLSGSAKLLERLATLLEGKPLDIHWGAQLTIDLILARKDLLRRLQKVGLRYLFIGIETLDPAEIGGMSKDTRPATEWLRRIRDTFEFLRSANVKCGCAVLFGLGESHASRLRLLDELLQLREEQQAPHPVSFNWAVQHPLRGFDNGANYEYLEWPTPEGPLLDLFQHFGEASARYPIPAAGQPREAEVRAIVDRMVCFSQPPVTPAPIIAEAPMSAARWV